MTNQSTNAGKKLLHMQNENNFVSEISLSYSPTYKRKIKLIETACAHNTLRTMWDTELMNVQEQFCVLFLNNANEVIGFRCLSTGTLTASLVDFRILFGLACKSLSSGIIISHNHPSGNLTPSRVDIDLTKKVKAAANIFGITLMDHIILTSEEYFSFKENNLI
jgi:DNA repair protein RadC